MRSYHVYQHPTKGTEAVKDGFSWPAFWFGALWLLGKRLFGIAMVVIVVAITTSALIDNDAIQAAIGLGIAFSLGAAGNQWRREKLSKRGYRYLGRVEAGTRQRAIETATSTESGSAEQAASGAQRPTRPMAAVGIHD